MGKYDSSITRVEPVFDRLLQSDPSGRDWIPSLLELPKYGGHVDVSSLASSPLNAHGWGAREKRLAPPLSLLQWLVANCSEPKSKGALGQGDTREKRRRLLERDGDTAEEALRLLGESTGEKAWYILEGSSQPDAFLATDDLIIVIEGKRTERGPTTTTNWMPNRHQILRHLDCAVEILGSRSLFGFFIVEGDDMGEVGPDWIDFANFTTASANLEDSLPHRSSLVREQIAKAFIGVTTWQLVCWHLGLSEAIMLETVPSTDKS